MKIKAIVLVVLIIVLQLAFSDGFCKQKSTKLPSWTVKTINSPNGKSSLLHNIKKTQDGGLHGELLYKKDSKSKSLKLLEYERNLEILWSENGDALLVNDNMGSNCADCYIYTFRNGVKKYGLWDLFPEKVCKGLEINHKYINGVEWTDNNTVRVKVWGDCIDKSDLSVSFEKIYTYSIGKGFNDISKK